MSGTEAAAAKKRERQVLRVIEEAVAESYYIDCDPGDRSKIARGIYEELIEAGYRFVGGFE